MNETKKQSEEPEALLPYVEPIKQIHRGPDGYVHFARSAEDIWQNLPAIAVANLTTIFPQFVQQLMRDSYFGINSRWRPERSQLTRLNACWVDIDLHEPGQMATVGQLIGRAIDKVEDEELPRPSITVYSGRGVWFLWLLVDEDGYPPKAFPEKILTLETINGELRRRLAGDPCACDAQRMLRVPGSTNSKADTGYEVVEFRFMPDLDASGRCSEYTLGELTDRLGLPSAKRKKSPPKIYSGWNALWTYRFQDFQLLREMRGGFSEGCRHHALRLYAITMQHLSFDDETIHHHLTRLAKECRPPLPLSQVNAVMGQLRREPMKRLNDDIIGNYLKVTPEEAKLVPRWGELPNTKEIDEVDSSLSPNLRVQYRQQVVAEIIAEHGGRILPCRQLARLMGQRGIQVSHMQVSKYVKAIPNLARVPSPQILLLNP